MGVRRLLLGTAAGSLLALHQYDTHFRHERFNRNVRTVIPIHLTLLSTNKFIDEQKKFCCKIESIRKK